MSAGDYVSRSLLEYRRIAEAIDAGRVIWIGTTTNSTNAYTGTATIPISRLIVGEKVRCIINTANSGAATLAILRPDATSGVAATSIKRFDGSTALSAGDLVAGPAEFLYDGTNLRLCWSGFGGTLTGDDEAYGSGWNSDLTFPTKNAVYDKIEAVIATIPTHASGTYSPTLADVANISSSASATWQYMRVGSVVTASGPVTIDATLTATSTQLGISLPVASDFGNVEQCSGVMFSPGIAGMGGAIIADTTNNRAQLQFISTDITSQTVFCIMTYLIV